MADGVKHDQGKPRFDLLPPRAVEAVARVLEFGARKYAPGNWQKVQGGRWRYTRAALGHVFAYVKGEQKDPESGENHLAHAACCVLFLLDFEERGEIFPE